MLKIESSRDAPLGVGIKKIEMDYGDGAKKRHVVIYAKPTPAFDNPFERVVEGLVKVNQWWVDVDHGVTRNDRALYIAQWPYAFMESVANEIPVLK